MNQPAIPPVTRMVEPVAEPAALPVVTRIVEPDHGEAPPVCIDCTVAGDEALAESTRTNAKTKPRREPAD
jgi:hypothetical protein